MKDNFSGRRPWRLVAIVLVALAVLGGILAIVLTSCGGPQTYTGYLICQDCGLAGKCPKSNLDLTAHPEQHTLKCLKMAECIVSGYGISIKQSDGKYKYYRFDGPGSTMALDNVVYVTKRVDNLFVEVTGRLRGNTIAVVSIAEK